MIDMNNLESLATEIGKDIKDIKTRFATKQEMHEVAEIDYSQIVTHDELEGKHYLTAHQDISHLATKDEVGRKVDKADFEVLKNDVVKHDELAGRNYLTAHQSLEEYAKKSELYNDTDIKRRLGVLEGKSDSDNQTLSLSGNRLSLTNGGSVELPSPDLPVYRIAKGDIPGSGVGVRATIQASSLLNPEGVKVGDIIQDFYDSVYGADEGFWRVAGVTGSNISVIGLGTRRVYTPYNDTELKRRLTSLEARPDFNSLTPAQKNTLRGPQGPQGPKGAQGLTGAPGLRGVPGQNIINQQNNKELRYWAGTQAQYDAIASKDSNTIYDIFK